MALGLLRTLKNEGVSDFVIQKPGSMQKNQQGKENQRKEKEPKMESATKEESMENSLSPRGPEALPNAKPSQKRS